MRKSIIVKLTMVTTALFLISCRPTTTDISICDKNTTPLNEAFLSPGKYKFKLLNEVLATVEMGAENKGNFNFKGKSHPTTVSFCTDESKNKFISFACEIESGKLAYLNFIIKDERSNSSSKKLGAMAINAEELLELQLNFPKAKFSYDKSGETIYIQTSPNFIEFTRSYLHSQPWNLELRKSNCSSELIKSDLPPAS